MNTARDLTEQQFIDAAKKQGFTHDFFGYWKLAAPHQATSVYRFNAGHRRRAQLVYLMEQQERAEAGKIIPNTVPLEPQLSFDL